MKRILILFAVLFAALSASAQTTPNYGFQVPPFNSPNWNVSMNQNWYSLDSILTNFANVGSGLQCHPLSSLGTPPAGVLTVACCADCQATNPCASGGSGQMAVGLNGQFNCASGASGGGGLADPGANNVFVFRTTLDVTRPATGTDLLTSFFTGPFSSACFLRGDLTCQAPPGSGVTSSATSPGPIAGYFGTAPSTQVKPDPNCTTDFAGNLTCSGLAATVVAATGSGANGPIYTNDTSTGTTAALLAKIVGSNAINATTSDVGIPVFPVIPTITQGATTICGPGTTGNVCLATSGQASLTTDAGGSTANDFAVISILTNGTVADGGATLPAAPACIVGTFANTVSGGAAATVNVNPYCYGTKAVTQWEVDIPFASCGGVGAPQIQMDPPPSGAVMTPGGCTGTNVNQGFAVAANTGTPALQYSFRLPQSLTGAADVYLSYSSSSTASSFTPVVDVICNNTNGSATNDPAFSAGNFFAPGGQTTPGTANDVQTVSATGVAWPGSCGAGTMAHFRPKRTDTSGATNINFYTLHIIGRKVNGQ